MDALTAFTVGLAWAAILAAMGWAVYTGWRRALTDDGSTLPFFAMLERRGIPIERLHGDSHLYEAVRRCALCRSRERCSAWLARRIGGPAPECPNADFMETVARR